MFVQALLVRAVGPLCFRVGLAFPVLMRGCLSLGKFHEGLHTFVETELECLNPGDRGAFGAAPFLGGCSSRFIGANGH